MRIFEWNRPDDPLYSDIATAVKKSAAVVASPPVAAIKAMSRPEPLKVIVQKPLPDLSEYEEIAAVLGFHPPELAARKLEMERREIMSFFIDSGFPLYDLKAVQKYMTGLAEKASLVFVWAPLHADERRIANDAMIDYQSGHMLQRARQNGQIVSSPYRHAVPIHILRRAVAVKDRFPEAHFYVSDYAVHDPDPFIAAKIGRLDLIVFGVWDEPGFEAKKRDREAR